MSVEEAMRRRTYLSRLHREIVTENERLRAKDEPGEPTLQDVANVCACVGQEIDYVQDKRASLVNLAAWALRGIAIMDGEKP